MRGKIDFSLALMKPIVNRNGHKKKWIPMETHSENLEIPVTKRALKFPEDFSVTAGTQCAPDIERDIFADCSDRAIDEDRIHDTRVITA